MKLLHAIPHTLSQSTRKNVSNSVKLSTPKDILNDKERHTITISRNTFKAKCGSNRCEVAYNIFFYICT